MTDDKPAVELARLGETVFQKVGNWQVVMTYREWFEGDSSGPMRVSIISSDVTTQSDLDMGIGPSVVRQIDFRKAAEDRRKQAQERPESAGRTFEDLAKDRADERAKILHVLLPYGITDEYLAVLAQAYIVLVDSGENAVTKRLAEITGRAPETIRAHLKMARKHDLLTSTPGRAGGQLTEKARGKIGKVNSVKGAEMYAELLARQR
ncbi:hypothetical protein R1X32_17125 [Rhodococcus opacus]|uniref:hypothetical protein n=1 Tax=Rhodococcus opacus TaxID=37919 RepID=UPI000A52744C|nr:hypothetical protein [Rhodococcus opacus]WKN58391.1 hypothetical protein HJ581_0034000 [Rhodococcus opacus]